MEQAKELKIPNYNNCLATDVFITIGIAPPREKVPPRSKVEASLFYATTPAGDKIFVRCVDLLFVKFDKLTDHFTLWAYGMTYYEYRDWWLEQCPNTSADTEMIICYYKKSD